MAELTDRPFPPGDYQVVVVGSGPGGLQTSYFLRHLGIRHAVISQDSSPGGMFQRFPLFQRLNSWTKPYAPFARGTREYEWYDWNSLLAFEPECSALVPQFLDGSTYFPARSEMLSGLVAFAERCSLDVRYECKWESTRILPDGRFELATTDGQYTSKVVVFAIGMTRPWKAQTPGFELLPHYAEVKDPRDYEDKSVFIAGKRNSAFEIADSLLPWAKRIILASPRPVKISVETFNAASARARYLQTYEDHVLGGGNLVLDAAIERVQPIDGGYRVLAKGTTRPGDLDFEVDAGIVATGWDTPLQDLPKIGVATFYGGDRLPAQTPFWESPSVPGIYFAGSVMQGAIGLKKYGIPSNSGAVHGFRYNSRILATHIADKNFGVKKPTITVKPDDVVSYLLAEATRAPELWNQPSYLARALTISEAGIVDEGIVPLANFVDSSGPDAVAVTNETDSTGDIHPAIYVRWKGRVDEHLLDSHPLHKFETDEHQSSLANILKELIG